MNDSRNALEEREISEMNGLVPFLDKDELQFLLAHLEPILKDHDYGKTAIYLDLEQLQIAYYPSLFSNTPGLEEIIALIQNSGMFDQRELDFLTLRSLVTLSWPKPTNNEQVELIAKTEIGLQLAMRRVAEYIRNRHPDRSVWLPYWARLAHFNLLRSLPEQQQNMYGPDGIPCILLRSLDINAHTFPASTGQIIVLDYALEPFLKNMNTFLVSYYESRDMSGSKRVPRAFSELLPRALFFKGLASAYSLPPFSMLFSEDAYKSIKATTDAQISFLIAHEIGHITLEHPGTRTAISVDKQTDNEIFYYEREHFYEYEADAFALDWTRARVINSFRYYLNPKNLDNATKTAASIDALKGALSEYAHVCVSVETLFLIIDFLEEFFIRLTNHLAGIPKPAQLKTHPNPHQRWERLQRHNLYDIPISSEFNEYAKNLFNSVLEFMTTLSGDTVENLIQEALKNES